MPTASPQPVALNLVALRLAAFVRESLGPTPPLAMSRYPSNGPSMSGSWARYMPGSYVPKGRIRSKSAGRFRIPKQYRAELTKPVCAQNGQNRVVKMSAKQKADLLQAAKLRDSRIKRLLLEAKIEKLGRSKPAITKALRRDVARSLSADDKLRKEKKNREDIQRSVERRKQRLSKLLKEIATSRSSKRKR